MPNNLKITCGSAMASIQANARRLLRDDRGIAAAEFAVFVPVMAGALLLMVDIGQGVYAKYDAERKTRLAIEGILRYGDDATKVLAFANASGNEAFPDSPDAPENTTTVTLDDYKVCRSSSGSTTKFAAGESPTCPNYETWYDVTVAGSITTGVFGKTYDFSTSVDVFSE